MKVSLFGLGYVGCVSAACLARAGHRVIGVDVNPLKVDILNSGQSPIVEKDVGALIMDAVAAGKRNVLAGLTVNGGWLHGMPCDRAPGFDYVTADGVALFATRE